MDTPGDVRDIIDNWDEKWASHSWAAIEDYDPVERKARRLQVGTEQQIEQAMHWECYCHIDDRGELSRFYRAVLIPATEALEFARAVAASVTEEGRYLDVEEFSVTEAADLLGVSRQRVHALIKSGGLVARRVGNAWLVNGQSLGERMADER